MNVNLVEILCHEFITPHTSFSVAEAEYYEERTGKSTRR